MPDNMKNTFLVFVGGGLGSVIRYLLGTFVAERSSGLFPLGTLVINILACAVLGVVIAIGDSRQLISSSTRLLIAVGFCGGFSTFSTYSLETFKLLERGQYMLAGGYIIASTLLCLAAVLLGIKGIEAIC